MDAKAPFNWAGFGASGFIIHEVDGRMVYDTYERGELVSRVPLRSGVKLDEKDRLYLEDWLAPEGEQR